MNLVSLVTQIVGLAVACAIVWVLGPIAPLPEKFSLQPQMVRFEVMGGLFALWLVSLVIIKIAARRKNDRMLGEMSSGQGQDIDAETRAINERFKEALGVLKSTGKGKRSKAFIYDIPWYIIIGPPGSGKTTALLNSGLSFPLQEKFGAEALRGVGGTRDCDWWFTNEAILIDTAGRFTSQDSHKKVDEAGWDKFIQLLKKYRPERPINGAMVTMSLSDLMGQTSEERLAYARTIRQRIEELIGGLGITFPIYFMFTKCDMVSGFNEFFARFGKDERSQVWGETFEFDSKRGHEVDVSNYGERFDRLVTRLEDQVLDRVHEERDRDSRAMILGFPAQMLSLRDIVCEFVNECFASNRYSKPVQLRGIYYTSGTQEGTPIDRLLGNLMQDFGIETTDAITFSGTGKSFFLGRLLKDVVFKEYAIAGADSKISLRRRLGRFASYVLAAGLIGVSAGAWTLSYRQNMSQISRIGKAIDTGPITAGTAAPLFRQTVAELDGLRKAASMKPGILPSLGLQVGDNVRASARTTYVSALENQFFPLVVSRIGARLSDAVSQGDTGQTYTLLKAYLMCHGLHEKGAKGIDTEFLASLNHDDWQQMFPDDAAMVASLDLYQSQLIQDGVPHAQLRDGLVRRARTLLAQSPLGVQIYQEAKQNLLNDHSLDLSFSDIAGANGTDVFASRSGQSLKNYMMPGMFTRAGYETLVLPMMREESSEYAKNGWVLGDERKQTSIDAADLRSQLAASYEADYIRQWDDLLSDLEIRDAHTMNGSIAVLQTAAAIGGPIESVIDSVVKQTRLSNLDKQTAQVASAGSVSGVLTDKVEAHFADYARLTEAAGGTSTLRRVVHDTRDVAIFIKETLMSDFADQPALATVEKRVSGNNKDVLAGLRAQVPFLPSDAKRWMQTLQNNAWSIVMDRANQEVDKAWKDNVYGFFKAHLAGKYPVSPTATDDAQPADFITFFSKDGILAAFVDKELAPFVRVDQPEWQVKSIDRKSIDVSRAALGQIKRLYGISRTFFPSKNSSGFTMTLSPYSVSGGIDEFLLNVGNASSELKRSRGTSITVTWPPASGSNQAWYEFQGDDNQEGLSDGPWSIFRLLSRLDVKATGNDKYLVRFPHGSGSVGYNIVVKGAGDILARNLFDGLKVPAEL